MQPQKSKAKRAAFFGERYPQQQGIVNTPPIIFQEMPPSSELFSQEGNDTPLFMTYLEVGVRQLTFGSISPIMTESYSFPISVGGV